MNGRPDGEWRPKSASLEDSQRTDTQGDRIVTTEDMMRERNERGVRSPSPKMVEKFKRTLSLHPQLQAPQKEGTEDIATRCAFLSQYVLSFTPDALDTLLSRGNVQDRAALIVTLRNEMAAAVSRNDVSEEETKTLATALGISGPEI